MARSSTESRSLIENRPPLRSLSIDRMVSGLGRSRDRNRSRGETSVRSGEGDDTRVGLNPETSQDPVQTLQNLSQRGDEAYTRFLNTRNIMATGSNGRSSGFPYSQNPENTAMAVRNPVNLSEHNSEIYTPLPSCRVRNKEYHRF